VQQCPVNQLRKMEHFGQWFLLIVAHILQ